MKTRMITEQELHSNVIAGGYFLIRANDGGTDPQYIEYMGRVREERRYFYQPVEPIRPPRQLTNISRNEIRPILLK